MTSDDKALEFFGTAGFEMFHTGGGCTAFGVHLNPQDDDEGDGKFPAYAHIIVTGCFQDTDGEWAPDAIHPHDEDKVVCVGYYDEDHDGSDEDDYEICHSWEKAVDAADRLANRHRRK